MEETPTWQQDGDGLTLSYLGWPLVRCQVWDGAVVVHTKAYSQGYQHSRTMATLEGARRFGDAWLAKWGAEAMAAVRNKQFAVERASVKTPLLNALGQPYPDIKVKPRRPRKRSR
jgi:hypothetical protein